MLATAGDVRLGGRDWDERLFNHLADEFVREYKTDPRLDPLSAQQLMQTCEDIKKDLSKRATTKYSVSHAGRAHRGEISRAKFEELTTDLLFRTESRITRLLRDVNHNWGQVDELICVGGSTRMPQVQEMLKRLAGKTPDASLSPDEAVAHGAAIHANAMAAQAPVRPRGILCRMCRGNRGRRHRRGSQAETAPSSAGAGCENRIAAGPRQCHRGFRRN